MSADTNSQELSKSLSGKELPILGAFGKNITKEGANTFCDVSKEISDQTEEKV